jgi:dTMP kinase
VAYQGFGRKISLDQIESLSRFVRGSLKPHLTFLLDVPPQVGLARIGKVGQRDRIERQSLDFHARVRQGFLTLARKNKKRFVVLDGRKSPSHISAQIKERLARVFHAR